MDHISRRFRPYGDCSTVPNIVVDGAPNPGTVLTLTHWPGIEQPDGYEADLSAEMAFRYLDDPIDHPPAEFVTNNHFDQDGLVGLFALTNPADALANRDLLIDLARAGDFARYLDRRAARASMTLWALANDPRSPLADRLAGLDDTAAADLALAETLPWLLEVVLDNERFRYLWEDEDRHLTASERAVADGVATIAEYPEDDLTVVDVPADLDDGEAHRFGAGPRQAGPLHPMAVNNASDGFRRLTVHGDHYRFVDRYETWVQLRTRRPRPRVDLRPLAEDLNFLDRDQIWRATAPRSLTPTLRSEGPSSLDREQILERLVLHLRTAPTAWDPYGQEPGNP